eukprot:3400-Heterococcus_DN1.PRE.1
MPYSILSLADDAPINNGLADNELITIDMPGPASAKNGTAASKAKRQASPKGKGKAKAQPASRTGIHTLSSTSSSSSSRGGSSSSFMAMSRQRTAARTASGNTAGGSSASSAPPAGRKRKRAAINLSSKEGIADQLLAAVEGAANGGSAFLRLGLRRAVAGRYDETKAEARVSAAFGGSFTIVESAEHRALNSGAAAAMNVTFAKGAGFRGYHEERAYKVWLALQGAVLAIAVYSQQVELALVCQPHKSTSDALCMHYQYVHYSNHYAHALCMLSNS